MTYTKADPIKRYCKSKQVMCEYANELGCCKSTACANPSSFTKTYTSNRTNYNRMTREEAIQVLNMVEAHGLADEAKRMAIEALSQPIVAKHFDIQSGYIYCSPQIAENVKVVVRCKDCRHAHECHKSVQYTRNEPRTVTIGYTPIEFCSHGERSEE